MKLKNILKKAKHSNAIEFERFLTKNNIKNTWLDVDIMDYNRDYFNITLDDYDNENILFYEGVL